MRKLRVKYFGRNDVAPWALIETANGFYVCEVSRCSGEGERAFRRRVRSLQHALEQYDRPMILTDPEQC